MRYDYVIDIDGILTTDTEGHNYIARLPNIGNINQLLQLLDYGYSVCLYTSRFSVDEQVTREWLATYDIPIDICIIFDKPFANKLYVDDKSVNNMYAVGLPVVSSHTIKKHRTTTNKRHILIKGKTVCKHRYFKPVIDSPTTIALTGELLKQPLCHSCLREYKKLKGAL